MDVPTLRLSSLLRRLSTRVMSRRWALRRTRTARKRGLCAVAFVASHSSHPIVSCRKRSVNDVLKRQRITKKTAVRKRTPSSTHMKIAAEKVLEYHSPLVFGADTFEPATALQDILDRLVPLSTLKDRQVTVRYSDAKLNNGKTFYFADGVITKIERLKRKTPTLKVRCCSVALHTHWCSLTHSLSLSLSTCRSGKSYRMPSCMFHPWG